jgi:hypothetical protein
MFAKWESGAVATTQLFDTLPLADLALLAISNDADTDHQAWGATLLLARCHRLTLYDAVYLELAAGPAPE